MRVTHQHSYQGDFAFNPPIKGCMGRCSYAAHLVLWATEVMFIGVMFIGVMPIGVMLI